MFSHLQVHSLGTCRNHGWARLNPGTWKSVQVSHTGNRDLRHHPLFPGVHLGQATGIWSGTGSLRQALFCPEWHLTRSARCRPKFSSGCAMSCEDILGQGPCSVRCIFARMSEPGQSWPGGGLSVPVEERVVSIGLSPKIALLAAASFFQFL